MHAAGDCTWVASFNRVRARMDLAPIVVLGSMIRIGAEKQQVTVESLTAELKAEKQEIRVELGKLEKRVSALKLKKKPQSDSGAGKATTSSEGPLTKKQRKAMEKVEKGTKKAK